MDYIHRRVLVIHFRLIEKCVREIKSMLDTSTADCQFILYTVRNDIDSEFRKRIFRMITPMLEQIQNVKEEFELELEEDLSTKRHVLSNLNEIWGPLKDLTIGRMHGYERLSEHDKQMLCIHFSTLFKLVEDIYNQMK